VIVVFTVRATLSVRCRVCKTETIVVDHLVGPGQRMPEPELPVGWSTVDGYPICQKHEIQVGE